MRNLTTLEKIVTLFVCVMVILICVRSIDVLPTEAIWILPSSVVIMLFIIVLLIAINDERENTKRLRDYDEKHTNKIIYEDETDTILMICNGALKKINREDCGDCRHIDLHMKTAECDEFNCHPVGRVDIKKVIGSWKKE